jgi:thiopeptide-type bacteriocin biosynthesis protein
MSEPTLPNDLAPSGFFVLRTPLLPFDELLAWSDGLEAASAGDATARLEAVLADDRARLRHRLRSVFTRPEVREALFVASPDLEGRFDLWLREPEGKPGQKIERALVRYFARMAGRATPFGLFAGCSVGTVGAETRLVLADRARYRRHTRLDMDYVVLLTDALAREPDLRRSLTFGVNSSLYPARGRFRYCEVRRNGNGWTHHQVALEASAYLEAALARAGTGASLGALAAVLLEADPEATRDEAEECIGELIDNQVLVSELRPGVTGPEPINNLAARLRERAATSAAERLSQARQELEALDAGGLGADPARYRLIAGLLEGLPGEVQLGRLFQVDMIKPVTAASLGPNVLDEILPGVTLLHRLGGRPREDRLSRFREAFFGRYEGREVALVEALDEDTGIGFDTLTGGSTDASALLDGLTFPRATEESVPWGRREVLLLRKLCEARVVEVERIANPSDPSRTDGAGAIVLEPHDLEEMGAPRALPLPDAFAVMATVAATSEAALARGDFQVLLHGVSGPSGARFLGRFCHADAKLNQYVEQQVRAEEALQPDAIFAEIIHLPEGRLGNILARPILRPYEIPYLGTASVPPERQIPVTDLRVSVVGEQIILRSARLGRRVLPRLTSAHNYHMCQGIYRFLCALQSQGTAGDLGWDWGPLGEAPFLPRVVSGRLVLARASWKVSQEEVKPLSLARGAARFRAVQEWRSARWLPRWIALADADNELAIDLENVVAIDTLLELIKGQKQATLVELFPGPDQLWARGPEGRFVHELVVPFVKKPKLAALTDDTSPDQHVTAEPRHVQRSFPPGSEWLYAKLYTGPATVDQILRDVVQPIVATVLGTGAADQWFFVRYGDPEWHLRLRIHGQPARLQHEVLPMLQTAAAPLLDDGRLWRIQFDTYEREVERYGGVEAILLAEQVFQADSEAVLALAARLHEDTRGDVRWRLALLGMDLLLCDLGFDMDAKRKVISRMWESFATELHADANLKHQLGSRFRQERKSLEALLRLAPSEDAQIMYGMEILRRRTESLAPVMAELQAAVRAGRLSVPLTELAPSYLHMHANRLLRSAHRAQELVLCAFLARIYESETARARPKKRAWFKSQAVRVTPEGGRVCVSQRNAIN